HMDPGASYFWCRDGGMADTGRLKRPGGDPVQVRVLLPAHDRTFNLRQAGFPIPVGVYSTPKQTPASLADLGPPSSAWVARAPPAIRVAARRARAAHASEPGLVVAPRGERSPSRPSSRRAHS